MIFEVMANDVIVVETGFLLFLFNFLDKTHKLGTKMYFLGDGMILLELEMS
jgi:hypothetical protein